MLSNKETTRVENYLNSSGIARAWYWIVIVLTMGSVDTAVEQYEEDKRRTTSTKLDYDPLSFENNPGMCVPPRYEGRGYVPATTSKNREDIGGYSYTIDEEEEDENIDLMTAAILANHINENQGELFPTETSQDEWGGFGGGGDLAGGGAGGDWSPSNDIASNTSPSMLSDSY
jgi:hypothetical protein